MKNITKVVLLAIVSLAVAGSATAANVAVNANIAVSTTWTKDNVYNLVGQIYVLPGASLTIQAGTLVASNPADQGSLCVCAGAKIFVMGTQAEPVIMTSTNDTATWTDGNPKTGTWRAVCNEWGNLTICGKALISASMKGAAGPTHVPVVVLGVPNTATPTGLNRQYMEGLTPADGNDTKTLFGGADDDDDSGEIHYLSLRYGGKVIGLGNELNGLSMGGIGRATEVDHVEVMNNVDDGIETWGGTVNYKYITIWNIGDDSFDFDEGWRGKLQFGLLVQGYSAIAARGSGVGDNVFEMDGAEDSDAQPVSTAVIYNVTAIGQPLTGRGGTTWRDGARIQFHNCIWMEVGRQLVRDDESDGDAALGYGYNGTLTFAQVWTTPYTTTSTVNAIVPTPPAGAFNNPAMMYRSQTSGMLSEITDSVFYNNLYATNESGRGTNYSMSDTVGVTVSGGSNPAKHNIVASVSPIRLLTRGAGVSAPDGIVLPVTRIDPRAASSDSNISFAAAPSDGFFTPAPFRGAFSQDVNWCLGWTAADAFGFFKNADGTEQTNVVTNPTAVVGMVTNNSFPTVAGVVYTVESSTDMKNWSPIGTIVGDGTTKSITDLSAFDTAKFYRAIAQ